MANWWPFRARAERERAYAEVLGEQRQESARASAQIRAKRRELEAAITEMMTTNKERADDARN